MKKLAFSLFAAFAFAIPALAQEKKTTEVTTTQSEKAVEVKKTTAEKETVKVKNPARKKQTATQKKTSEKVTIKKDGTPNRKYKN